MTERKKRNIIIGSLCTVLLLMVVGYAAFSSVLKIKGTSNINSNWDIKITSITSEVLHGSATNAKDPEGIGTLTASFETNLVSPGDSIKYTITVANQGNINAKLDKITISEPDNEYVTFETSGLTEGEPFNAGSTADLIVTVTFKDVEINKIEPTTSTLKVTLDYVQEGSSGGTIIPDNKQVVYSYSTNTITNGDSLESISQYTNDYTTLNKDVFLKHNIVNDQVESSELCFIKDGLYCLIRPSHMGERDINENFTPYQIMNSAFEEKCYIGNTSVCNFEGSCAICYVDSWRVDMHTIYEWTASYGSSNCQLFSQSAYCK